uniref:Interleukin family protein n=1 Tax=Salarias fasciatus TaxID=181472 RepID=A0A672IEU6_SALFA
MLLSCSLCLLLLLGCLSEPAHSRTLQLDSCSVTVHLYELRRYHSDIRSALSEDSNIGVKILDKALITDVQEGQMCCFMQLLMRFYVERVFGSFGSSWPQYQRFSSALANAFVTIRKDIRSCHCLCEEDTQKKIDSVNAEFIKLEVSQAALKAMGELDTVLDWLDALKDKN